MQSIFCTNEDCEKCGRCCRSFFTDVGLTSEEDNSIRNNIYETTGIIYPHPIVMRLCMSPKVADDMRDEAEKRGIMLKLIPNKTVYDAENDRAIIIDFILDMDHCPFVSNENLCTFYEKRPRVCRQFPKIQSNIDEIKAKIIELGINPNVRDYETALKRVQELFQN